MTKEECRLLEQLIVHFANRVWNHGEGQCCRKDVERIANRISKMIANETGEAFNIMNAYEREDL